MTDLSKLPPGPRPVQCECSKHLVQPHGNGARPWHCGRCQRVIDEGTIMAALEAYLAPLERRANCRHLVCEAGTGRCLGCGVLVP